MDVLITSEPEKLPPEVRALEDPARPLPAGVQFFERQYTYDDLLKPLLWAAAVIPVGVLLLLFAIFAIIFRDHSTVYATNIQFELTIAVIGFVLIGAGYLLLKSLGPRYRFLRQQSNGVGTRQGIFLAGDLLVSHDVMDTTIIPRAFFRGLKDHKVQYELKAEAKSFDLPQSWVGTELGSVEAAIGRWAT